jgi:hypothetical protein
LTFTFFVDVAKKIFAYLLFEIFYYSSKCDTVWDVTNLGVQDKKEITSEVVKYVYIVNNRDKWNARVWIF